ncbi:AraC family transcriptional regulator [uncultured Aquimarina sp.]|uniref:AraC family transcriptional regulator n=1 Tax=uncultured Aquimarina sp. TaxID=575652 RepID=UPI002601AAEF|nr:AraC family transcriptional regulator [uncultured Aquimarina sp.]
MRLKLTILLFLFALLSFGQSYKTQDSLASFTYSQIADKFYEYIENEEIAKIYANEYINRAKNQKDSSLVARAYMMKRHIYKKSSLKKIEIWDSVITYGLDQEEEHWPEMLYNSRALLYHNMGNQKKSLEDYLSALKYAKRNNNTFYINALKHNVAILKRNLGKYEEAKNLFMEALEFGENEMLLKQGKLDSIGYLLTLAETISAFRLNKKIDSAEILNHRGSELSKNKEIDILFRLNEGILDYHNKKYFLAIQKIEKSIPEIIEKRNTYTEAYNLIEAYLHIGLSYKGLDNQEKAIKNFMKTDSIAETQNHFIPELITAHKELVNHYKSKNDKTNQLKYINKLLKSDSILTSNYKIVGDQLFREFDTRELIQEKEQAIAFLEKENSKTSIKNLVTSGLLILSIIIASFYFYRQRLYKQRFLKLVADQSTDDAFKKSKNTDNRLAISEEITQHLIECLQQFEDSKEFLNPDINMSSLAKSFNSNSNYLSKVINKHKGKNFTQYMNDLRVDYVIDKLKNDPIFRKYTVLALAQEIGFNNPESFSKAFYKNAGIYPSYFIRELLKQP